MLPVHYRHTGDMGLPEPNVAGNATTNTTTLFVKKGSSKPFTVIVGKDKPSEDQPNEIPPSNAMLWLYVMFVYLFSAYALYLIISHTKKIIRVRQAYLGGQSSVTDKTIKLSGVPQELRSEEAIKETIENLQIGKVDSVLLCKDWSELDDLLVKRSKVLRNFEEAWTKYAGSSQSKMSRPSVRSNQNGSQNDTEHGGEGERLLQEDEDGAGHQHDDKRNRPTIRIWYGFLNLQSRKIDALDYYQEKLRKLDEQVVNSRKKVFKPTPIAFVTMDSSASAVSGSCSGMDGLANRSCSKWLCKQ